MGKGGLVAEGHICTLSSQTSTRPLLRDYKLDQTFRLVAASVFHVGIPDVLAFATNILVNNKGPVTLPIPGH